MPHEREVLDFDHTSEPRHPERYRPAPESWMSGVLPRGEGEPWRDGRQRVDDALAPATGIAVAMLVATLLWALIAWFAERISVLTPPG